MNVKSYLSLINVIKENTSKIDILIFFLAIAIIAVGIGPQF